MVVLMLFHSSAAGKPYVLSKSELKVKEKVAALSGCLVLLTLTLAVLGFLMR